MNAPLGVQARRRVAGFLLVSLLVILAGGIFSGFGGGRAGGGLRCSIGRIESHPDRQVFFMENVTGNQQKTLEAFPEQRLPLRTNHGKLLT